MSDIWLGLERFNDLFYYMPADLKTALIVVLTFLIGLGVKRIFLG